MRKNEKGSVSAIVVVTILFILMILGTYLTTISSKRKSQLQETMLLQNAYEVDINSIYQDQAKTKSNLASLYTDIMYIEASGTQNISGIILPDNYKISITASLEEGTNYNIFDSSLGAPKLGINGNKKVEFKAKKDEETTSNEVNTVDEQNAINENTVNQNTTSEDSLSETKINESNINFGQKLTITNDCSGVNSMVLIDGAKVMEDDKVNGPITITMFNGFKGKIYSISIYADDDLKYNLVPCYENATKKVGLYDNIGKIFYRNSGTGIDFKAGPEI